VTLRMRMRRVACSITARQDAVEPLSRSTVKKSQARMAWERWNWDQVGPVGGGRIDAVAPEDLHTVDACTASGLDVEAVTCGLAG
jgi:hypothetical protein